jgi:alpha-mannosidase
VTCDHTYAMGDAQRLRIMGPSMTTLLHLIPRRVHHLLGQLDALRWRRLGPVEVRGSAVLPTPCAVDQAQTLELAPVALGELFGLPGGGWQQRWFRIDVPAGNNDRVLFWKCQGETTVWIDGEAWAGLDPGHDYCALPVRASTLWLDCGTYQTSIGGGAQQPLSDQPCRFREAWLAERVQPAWDAFFDLEALVMLMNKVVDQDALRLHRPGHPIAFKLLPALAAACDRFEDDGIVACAESLRGILGQFPAEGWQDIATVVGHSHLDLVWLWPEVEGERKAVHTAATAMRLLERYPEMTFTYSQPASYAAITRRAPGLATRISDAIRSGRWEATGALEVESDTHLPCGEALLRAVLVGQRGFTALRGSPSTLCWLPDTFGFTACLPQILAAAGVSGFFTTKLGWSEITDFPYRSFRWRSPDGSEVLAHNSAHHPNGEMTLQQLAWSGERNRQAGVLADVLLPQGFGDGGGGPNEAMCERARRLANLAQCPTVRWGNTEGWFARLAQHASQLPVFDGELYLERHQGVFTSQARCKQAYRTAEVALQLHEAVRTACRGAALDDEAWRRVIFAQFHDALPGSSIAVVYDQLVPELEQLATQRISTAISELAARSGREDCLFNALPTARRALVALPGCSAAAIRCGDAVLPVQHLDGVPHASIPLPALAGVAWTGSDASAPATHMTAGPGFLGSDRAQARFDADGGLVELRIDGELIPLSAAAGLVLHREGTGGDAWDIQPQALAAAVSTCPVPLGRIDQGPVAVRLSGSAALGRRSQARMTWSLVAGLPWLLADLDLDWQEDASWLRFRLPTALRGRQTRFGTPFGSVLRAAQSGDDAQTARWEVPGSRWAAVTDDDGVGAALISEAKYGWHCGDGTLHLSLLRAPDSPAPGADRGRQRIRFAIGRHRTLASADACTTAEAADSLYLPVPGYRGSPTGTAPIELLPGSSLAPAWVLPGVLRLHEVSGRRGTACLRSTRQLHLADVHGHSQTPLSAAGDNLWRVDYQPNALLSISFA